MNELFKTLLTWKNEHQTKKFTAFFLALISTSILGTINYTAENKAYDDNIQNIIAPSLILLRHYFYFSLIYFASSILNIAYTNKSISKSFKIFSLIIYIILSLLYVFMLSKCESSIPIILSSLVSLIVFSFLDYIFSKIKKPFILIYFIMTLTSLSALSSNKNLTQYIFKLSGIIIENANLISKNKTLNNAKITYRTPSSIFAIHNSTYYILDKTNYEIAIPHITSQQTQAAPPDQNGTKQP